MQGNNCFIGLSHALEVVRYKMIHRKLSFHASIDQGGNVSARLESTKGSTLPHSAGHELERAGGDLVTRSRHTNDARDSPATMRAFQSRTHDIHVSSAVERVVDSPLGHCAGNVLLNGTFNVFRVYAIRCTELFGIVKLGRIGVYSNDPGCTRYGCALDNGKTLRRETILKSVSLFYSKNGPMC
jgi:hypothetical protein